jgi:hypothetical protein
MANYEVETQDDLTKWWFINAGSGGRLSDLMDDCPDGPAIYHRDADNDWTAATGAEHYVATATKPDNVSENLAGWRNMTDAGDDQDGSLAADEWSYDTGNNRVYIRLSNDSDPDATDVRCDYDWDGAGAGPAIMTEHVVDRMYQIHLLLEIGDASTTTVLVSENESVYFDDTLYFEVTANATLTLGELHNSWGRKGSYWSIAPDAGTCYVVNQGTLNLYASTLNHRGATYARIYGSSASVIIKNSNLNCEYDVAGSYNCFYFQSGLTGANLSIEDLYVSNSYGFLIYSTPVTVDDVHLHDNVYGIMANNVSGTIFYNSKVTDAQWDLRTGTGGTPDLTVVDTTIEASPTLRIDVAASWVKQAYTVNIHVADKDHVSLEDAVVACEYGHVVLGTDTVTSYRCILDHTAGADDDRPTTGANWETYWEVVQLTPVGGLELG